MSDPAARRLPPVPHPDFYRNEAKALLKAAAAADGPALERFARFHPRGAAGAQALHDAQWVIAREHGSPSWPAFLDAVAAARIGAVGLAEWLDDALWPGRGDRARAVLARRRAFATGSLAGACVAGEAGVAEALLAEDPGAAGRPTGPRGWPPLLYLCFSRFLSDPARAPAMHRIARRLLALGADPNASWHDDRFDAEERALYGAAGIAGDPVLTAMLLDAGADPDDGETLYHAAELADRRCLALVLAHARKRSNVSHCLRRKLDFEDAAGTALFLEHGADPNADGHGGTALHHAIRRGRSLAVVELLLEAGADPDIAGGDGVTAYALACRLGRDDLAAAMRRRGARAELSATDRALAALAAGTGAAVPDAEAPQDATLLAIAVQTGDRDLAARLVAAGFDLDARHEGLPPLHWACWFGHAALVDLLVAAGARLETRNAHGSTALGTAVYASSHCDSPTGGSTTAGVVETPERAARYGGIVAALIAAGAEVAPAMAGVGIPPVDRIIRRHLP